MPEFNIPEDLTEVSGEDLQNLLDDAKSQFNELYESEDISNEALESMEQLATSIEGLVAEQDRRTEASSQRTELAAKAAKSAKVTAQEEEEETEEEAKEKEESASKSKAAKASTKEEAVVETAVEDSEPEAVESNKEESTPAEEDLVAANKPATSIAVPERGPQVLIAAAVDVPQFYVGQRLDPASLASALHNKARMLSDSRGAETVYPVATIERPFGEGYDLEGLDQASTWDRIQEMSAPNALTAAGGWCAPSQIVYDLFEVECESELLYTLPTFRVTRGGIRWPVFEPHDEDFDPGFIWTEDNDIAATAGTPTKPCVRITCPTFTECRLDAVGLCITAGNLIDRAYPEQVRWFINRAMRAFERNNALRKLNLVLADTVAVAILNTFAAASSIVASLLLQAADYRQLHGLCFNETLDVTLPSWVTDLVKADVARQQGVFTGEGSLPTDQAVSAWFQSAGLNLRYIDNWQEFTHPALDWPASVDALITYPGAYVEFNQGRLDLGVIRDSVLNETNDYTAVWFEEFYCVGRRGPQGRVVTIPICASGEVGARAAGDGAFVCP